MLSTRWLMIVTVLFALLWAPSVSLAQQWPERTVKVVVPYGAGGVTDIMARVTADRLGKILKQTFVVEDKPGAGGAIGVNYAMHAPQDGYTILFVGSTLFTVLPLVQNVDYVPLKDLVPVSITGTNGMILVVAKDAPYSTLSEFISFARAPPRKNHLFERRHWYQQSPVGSLSCRQGRLEHGACAVQRRASRS